VGFVLVVVVLVKAMFVVKVMMPVVVAHVGFTISSSLLHESLPRRDTGRGREGGKEAEGEGCTLVWGLTRPEGSRWNL